jgi:hypothetical protein
MLALNCSNAHLFFGRGKKLSIAILKTRFVAGLKRKPLEESLETVSGRMHGSYAQFFA